VVRRPVNRTVDENQMKLDDFNEETDQFIAASMNSRLRVSRLNHLARRRRNAIIFSMLYTIGLFGFLVYTSQRIDNDTALTIDGLLNVFMLLFPFLAALIEYRNVVSEIRLLKIVDALARKFGKIDPTFDAKES
jgi:hypothetical protein